MTLVHSPRWKMNLRIEVGSSGKRLLIVTLKYG